MLPDCAGYPFKMSRIYPTKQREVRAVYELLKPLAFIKRVFIFGSSTNNKCTLQSDLDIVIETDLTESIEDRAYIQNIYMFYVKTVMICYGWKMCIMLQTYMQI